MPTTIEEIESHLKSLDLNVLTPNDAEAKARERGLSYAMDPYKNPDGEPTAFVQVLLMDDGTYVEFNALDAYNVRDCKHKGAVFAALLEINYKTKRLSFGYDPADGEICVTGDLTVADGALTPQQLQGELSAVLWSLEHFYPVIRHAMETGKVDLSLATDRTPSPTEGDAEVSKLIESLGGIEGLRRLVRDKSDPKA